jgi:hypothetical protein
MREFNGESETVDVITVLVKLCPKYWEEQDLKFPSWIHILIG